MASSFDFRFGAKPPSSPTDVDNPRPFNTDFKAWKISVPARSASAKFGRPIGSTMNSCMSILLSAWAPPLTMFIVGTGSCGVRAPARCFHSGSFFDAATACAFANETPSKALAPSLLLFALPSSAINLSSSPRWSLASKPLSASAIVVLTLATALRTPLPM